MKFGTLVLLFFSLSPKAFADVYRGNSFFNEVGCKPSLKLGLKLAQLTIISIFFFLFEQQKEFY